jgi:hypothetical protein
VTQKNKVLRQSLSKVSMSVFFSSNIAWDETELFNVQQHQHQQNLKSLNIVMGYTREEESW